MSRLKIFDENTPAVALVDTADGAEIAAHLREIGVRFERWQATAELSPTAGQEEIIRAYRADIERLQREGGYQAVDVIRLAPDNPNKAELRKKFLDEHTHSEDEVRFFVEGGGVFYLHAGGKVYATLCEQGDLISVPDGMRHWFDMGENPRFAAIRLFTNPEGWVARHTGDAIAASFEDYARYCEGSRVKFQDVKGIVTDIEGTTSALSFVKDVLFPYARAHIVRFIHENAEKPEIAAELAAIRASENAPTLSVAEIGALLEGWIDRDLKATPLKTLQGLLWAKGYAEGAFRGHIYEDAAQALRAWHAAGVPLYVYSSGSIAAQKLLFGHTPQGDLTPLFNGYFDTTTGGKLEAESYTAIAAAIGQPASKILFLSDNPKELEAAQKAGMQVLLLARDGQATAGFAYVRHFKDIVIQEDSHARAAA